MKRNEIPKYGNLQGVKVLSTGLSLAGPFAASLFAEQGADVIQVESTNSKDMLRMFGDLWSVEHRNQRGITLNIPSPEGREVLSRLLKTCDILIESSKGGTWEKWGLTDEVLWKINPKLVIAHVSGFGQSGDPAYVKRGSFDPIGQAFSGFMAINGEPDPAPPYAVKPFTCDYITALFTTWAVLAALIHARETGVGESIDTAQYEAMARIQGNFLTEGLNNGIQAPRMGNKDLVSALENVQKCKDGNWVMLAIGGTAVCKRFEDLLGLGDDPDFAEPHSVILRTDGARVEKIVQATTEFCQSHTAEEVDKILNALQIPCSTIMTYEMMLENSQYKARNTIVEWHDPDTDQVLKSVGPIPKFKNNPSQIFRSGPSYGMDNEDVLSELGFSDDEIKAFYEGEIIKK